MADGKVEYDVRANTDNLDSDLDIANKKAEKGASKLGSIAGGTAKAIGTAMAGGVAAGTVALVGFGKQGVALASDLNEVQNVVDTTFGDKSVAIDDWAKKASKSFGLSELSAKQMTSTMGAMLKSMQLAPSDVEDMSTSLSGLAGDMASFYNLDAEDAFEKLRSGISGETEPLKQLGINMSQSNLEAFALSKGINKSWNEMSQAEQTTLRYQYIMNATKDAQGDFSKTSDSFANQQRILQMQFESLSAEVGGALLPVLTDLMGTVGDLFTENDTFKDSLKDIFEAIATIAEEALPPLLDSFSQLLPTLMQLSADLLPVILDLFSALIPTFTDLMTNVMPVLIDTFKQLLPPILDIIEQLLPPLLDLFKELMPIILDIATSLLPPLVEIFKALLPPIMELIQTLLPPLMDLLSTLAPLFDALTPIIKFLAKIIGDELSIAIKFLSPIIEALMSQLSGLITFITDVFSGDWSKAWNSVKDVVKSVFNTIPETIESVLNSAINGINRLINGINKISSKVGIDAIPEIEEISLPKFHTGGIIDFQGEIPILGQGGEMVLTRAQQAQLFQLANGKLTNGIGKSENISNNNSETKIEINQYNTVRNDQDIKLIGEQLEFQRIKESAGVGDK